jgi:hypothetical protein
MEQKTYILITSWFFAVVALCHLLRALFGWEVVVAGSWFIPVWCSWIAFIVTGYLSYTGFKLQK